MSDKPEERMSSAPEAPTPEERRGEIRDLVDRIPDFELWRVGLFLRGILDPESTAFFWKHAMAPYDDQPLTEEDEARLRECREGPQKLRPFEDVVRELGL